MTLPILMLAGAGIGVGVLILAASLRRPLPSLSEAMARVATPAALVDRTARQTRTAVAVALGHAVGLDRLLTDTVRRDLRALARSPEDHIARSLLTGLELGAIPPALAAVLAVEGVGYRYSRARRDHPPVRLGRSAAAYGGPAQPKRNAAGAASNTPWAPTSIWSASTWPPAKASRARWRPPPPAGRGRRSPRSAKPSTGPRSPAKPPGPDSTASAKTSAIAELRELAATVSLAGDVGAKVRDSLAAKAATLRSRGLAEIEEAANAANERMSLPVVLLVVAFIVFIGYPAVFRIIHGL